MLYSAAPRAASDAPVAFDIPSQPMAAALNAWALQADAQLFVDPGRVAHLVAPAVKGTLPPQVALRGLLAHSNLKITRGTDGVYLITPSALAATSPRTPATPPATAPLTPAPAPEPAAVTARDSEGPWLLRFDAAYVKGDDGTSSGGTAAFGAEYFMTDHLAGGVAFTLPRSDSLGGRGHGHLQSSTLTLKYSFTPEDALRPYVAAGLDVTALHDAREFGDRTTVGPVVQAGLDLRLEGHWMLNADVSWAQVRSGDLRIDPLQVGVGVAYRF